MDNVLFVVSFVIDVYFFVLVIGISISFSLNVIPGFLAWNRIMVYPPSGTLTVSLIAALFRFL